MTVVANFDLQPTGRWMIPDKWSWVLLGQLGDVVGGGTPRNSEDDSNYDPQGIPWLTPADLSGYRQTYIERGRRSLSTKGLENSAARRMPPGTVLLSSRAPVGYCVIARNEISTNQGFKSIIPSRAVLPEFLRYYLLHSKTYLESQASGTTFLEISGRATQRLEVPLAPLNEQRRIVNKIDELFSDIEGGERALERARKLLDRYRQTVLKAAVSGELTTDWREKHKGEIESGESLLSRILKVRRAAWEQAELAKVRAKGHEPKDDQWKLKYEDPAPPETSNLPRVPNGWAWSTLEMLTDGHEANGISIKGSDNPPGVVALRLDAIQEGHVDYTARRYIPLEPQRAVKYEVREGDFFISRANGSKPFLARAALAASDPPSCVFPDTVIRFRPIGPPSIGEWLQAIWPSRMVREQVESSAKTSAGIWKVSQDDLRAVLLPLPPLPEVAVAIERLRACQSEVDAIDSDLSRGRDSASMLRQSILTAAFSGKLVPQDPSDEPASVLLDRIRAERTAANKPPVKRRGRQPGKASKVAAEPELPLA